MHAWRFWNRDREAHHSRKGGQPIATGSGRGPRARGLLCSTKASPTPLAEPDADAGVTIRYVNVDNFR
jgi:hypothetical protein